VIGLVLRFLDAVSRFGKPVLKMNFWLLQVQILISIPQPWLCTRNT
jgi:hypothetical protein